MLMEACFKNGQMGHLKRNYPLLHGGSSQGSMQLALPLPIIVVQLVKQVPTPLGRGGGKGIGQKERCQS